MSVLIGSTIPAFNMADGGHWREWLSNAVRVTCGALEEADERVGWLAVLQTDGRGREPFQPLLDEVENLRGRGLTVDVHWFSLDRGEHAIGSGNRFAGICTGRNLIVDHALETGAEWIYFADSDIIAPDDILPRLLEVGWPVVGGHVPTYCLDGPPVMGPRAEMPPTGMRLPSEMRYWGTRGNRPENADVRRHWNTAGSLLMHRDAFRRVPWRFDPDTGQTDDPATQAELERLGIPTLVRHDVVCRHVPEIIGPLEGRGHDLTVYR